MKNYKTIISCLTHTLLKDEKNILQILEIKKSNSKSLKKKMTLFMRLKIYLNLYFNYKLFTYFSTLFLILNYC